MTLHAWSSARYVVPLPAGHRFPIEKYGLLREAVLADGTVTPASLHEPDRVPMQDLLRAHDAEYVERVEQGTLTAAEQRVLGLPWSEALAERSFRTTGATLEAARFALTNGLAMNLAGGTHHAFASHGEGFCVFNDAAVAVRSLRANGLARRAAIVDLDVHQGNGTHAIFAGDDETYTFSMHGRNNYPFRKVAGRLDIELVDGIEDDAYLTLLNDALPGVLATAQPDILFFLAGADPHEGDRLGRLKLTFEGLMRRDRIVLESCRAVGVPVVIMIAGGYGRDISDTVRVHRNTARIASSMT